MSERTPIVADAPADDVDIEVLPAFDPERPQIYSAWGRKGSGKSHFNGRLFQSWPYDKLAIDVNGDAYTGPNAVKVKELRHRFPDAPRQLDGSGSKYQSLVYEADPGSATYSDDLDRAVGMALMPQDRKVLVWCGEVGEFTPTAQKTRPHLRRLLMQNRHYQTSALFDGPRPMNVDPLILAQSDWVAVFDLPNPADRERIASTIGYPPKRFTEECDRTFRRGDHWFLLWDARGHVLYRVAPLPELERPAP